MLQNIERATYTISEFCLTHRLSRSALYKMWERGVGPRYLRTGKKVLISVEAAADWRAQREAQAAAQTAEPATAA
jgi:hypothetical protein